MKGDEARQDAPKRDATTDRGVAARAQSCASAASVKAPKRVQGQSWRGARHQMRPWGHGGRPNE